MCRIYKMTTKTLAKYGHIQYMAIQKNKLPYFVEKVYI